MTLNDFATLTGIILTSVTLVVGVATRYLRVFVSHALGEAEQRILAKVEATYPRAEMVSLRFSEFERRLTHLEQERGR